VKDFAVADPAGILTLYPVLSADGRSIVYNVARGLSNLHLVDGLK
jgi:hypothetical protein